MRCPECAGWLDYLQQSVFCSLWRGLSRLKAPSGFGPKKPYSRSVRSMRLPVELVDSFSANKALVFPPDGDGNSRLIAPGAIKSTVTNLDSGAATDVILGGKVAVFFGGDGSVRAEGTGTIFVWYSPAEAAAAETGAGLFLVQGRATEQYSTEGVLLQADYTGRLVDLCAELGS